MGFKVTDTQEISQMTRAGSEIKVNRVWIVTDRGSSGYVDVPLDKWNANDLPGILKTKADELDLAFSLTG